MALDVIASVHFKKDVKRAKKRGLPLECLKTVVDMLMAQQILPPKYRDHALTGTYSGFRECHVLPDWLLVYRIENDTLQLFLFRTGSHSDLF